MQNNCEDNKFTRKEKNGINGKSDFCVSRITLGCGNT